MQADAPADDHIDSGSHILRAAGTAGYYFVFRDAVAVFIGSVSNYKAPDMQNPGLKQWALSADARSKAGFHRSNR